MGFEKRKRLSPRTIDPTESVESKEGKSLLPSLHPSNLHQLRIYVLRYWGVGKIETFSVRRRGLERNRERRNLIFLCSYYIIILDM
jgi:hypothetical protein